MTLTAASIKIVWTTPPGGVNSSSCNPAGLPAGNVLAGLAGGQPTNNGGFATGGRAWATHWHTVPGIPAFGTETKFTNVPLTVSERNVLNENCAFIIGNGSGAGRCGRIPLVARKDLQATHCKQTFSGKSHIDGSAPSFK